MKFPEIDGKQLINKFEKRENYILELSNKVIQLEQQRKEIELEQQKQKKQFD